MAVPTAVHLTVAVAKGNCTTLARQTLAREYSRWLTDPKARKTMKKLITLIICVLALGLGALLGYWLSAGRDGGDNTAVETRSP